MAKRRSNSYIINNVFCLLYLVKFHSYMCVYVHMCMYMYVCMYVYIYLYIYIMYCRI